MSAEARTAAIQFHETYERLAPQFGYETRPDTKAFDPDSPNGRLMIAVCGEVLNTHAVESVLECVVCGERSFVISPINDSDGFCFAEQKIYSITWPTLADPDGKIAEVGEREGV